MARSAGERPPHAVRIIGGRLRRSRLPVPDRPGLRPTPDRVRETLFNWLGQDLTGRRCLDAFAGSGALGFEAASRGAAEVVMIERDPALARGLRSTAERLQASSVRVECADALSWMAAAPHGRCDVVFLDPPFDAGLAMPALHAASRLLSVDGVVYLEAAAALTDDEAGAAGYDLLRSGRAGAVHFHLLRCSAPADAGGGAGEPAPTLPP